MTPFAQHARSKITAFVAGVITIDDLWLWLCREEPETADESAQSPEMVKDAVLWIVEYSGGHRSLEEVRLLLAGHLYLDNMRPNVGGGIQFGSASMTIYGNSIVMLPPGDPA